VFDLVGKRSLSAGELDYVDAARADNTLRGYRSDWNEWATWCGDEDLTPLPAEPASISRYLVFLADHGVKVTTMSRRMSALRLAHKVGGLPDPTTDPLVTTVWEGIRRTHGTPVDQAAPLMPPELHHVVDACPLEKRWKSADRAPEPDLAGHRDRALLLVGFVAALRRSELAALTVDQVGDHPNGAVLALPRSKSNQHGDDTELVVLPRAGDARRCAVQSLARWLDLAGIDEGPVFRRVTKANVAGTTALNPGSINQLVQRAIARAGIDPAPYSAHSLRAGFVTYAHLRGASDRAIAHQTRHRSLAALGGYVRVNEAWVDNAATQLGF
jgi:site-specific recombinase XerD